MSSRRGHVPLVAVAVPRAARGGPHLPRHGQRRLVRQLPDDARLDPGRGRAPAGAATARCGWSSARSGTSAISAYVRGERPPPRRARAPGTGTRSRSARSASCSAASTASSSTLSRRTARDAHACSRRTPTRSAQARVRADLAQATRRSTPGRPSPACASSSRSCARAAWERSARDAEAMPARRHGPHAVRPARATRRCRC